MENSPKQYRFSFPASFLTNHEVFWKPSVPLGCRSALDPITVARSADMRACVDRATKYFPFLRDVFDDSLPSFCGRSLLAPPDGERIIPNRWYPSLASLAQQRVIATTKSVPPTKGQVSLTYFEVEKERLTFLGPVLPGRAHDTLVITRSICNAKKANNLFAKPPAFSLIRVETFFELVAVWKSPHFFTLDLRHWFHQLSLPRHARSMFRMQVGKAVFHYRAWPMGFAWSPVVAQSISLAMAADAARAQGFEVQFHDGYISLHKDSCVTGFIVVYYDNFLAIMKSEDERDLVATALRETLRKCSVVFKDACARGSWLPRWVFAFGTGNSADLKRVRCGESSPLVSTSELFA